MRKQLCCNTPSRRVQIGWISFQPDGAISFGLNDKTYIAPQFKGQHFVWNAYNRIEIAYIVPSDPLALERVPNPHFTYHPDAWFHLKPTNKKDGDSLFEAIADVPIVLSQQSEMPWIRAVTSPISGLRSSGRRSDTIDVEDLVICTLVENVSVRMEIDFIRPENCSTPTQSGNEWKFAWHKVGIRILLRSTQAHIATLSWFHFY